VWTFGHAGLLLFVAPAAKTYTTGMPAVSPLARHWSFNARFSRKCKDNPDTNLAHNILSSSFSSTDTN